jgi:hypothetical protein
LVLPRVERPTISHRLVAEAVGVLLAAAAVAWLGWLAFSWLALRR